MKNIDENNSKIFVNNIEQGFSLYKRAVEAKTPQNKIKLSKKAEDNLCKSVNIAEKLKLKEKIPLIYEYLTNIQILIAINLYLLKDVKESVIYFKKALESNEKSDSKDKNEKFALIYTQLASISKQIQQFDLSIKYMDSALNYAKNLSENEYLEYLYEANQIYILGLDVKKVKNTFSEMLKMVNKSHNLKLTAKIYFDYARYLFEVEKKYKEAKNLLEKSKELFEKVKDEFGIDVVNNFINSNFDSIGNPIIKKN